MKVLSSWWLDVKLGVRMLVKFPGLALAGIAGIAVAVAIAAGAFSLIDGNFLTSSVPLEEGDRLVAIELWDSAASRPETRLLREFQLWRAQLKSIQEISAFRVTNPNLFGPGTQPESVRVAVMSASGFRVARVRPLIGRHLEETDERDGAAPVAVIGESVWRDRFASDPAILGRTIQFGATPHTIIGVMPKGFAFPVHDNFWVPLRTDSAAVEPLTGPSLTVFGRLAPGVTLAAAQAELTAVGQRDALAHPGIYAALGPQVTPYPRPFAGIHGSMDVTGLLAMQGIFIALLVLVSLNVTILVYTRTAMRQAEISLRTALGASRGRIVAQLFLEALVLSTVAAIAGVALAAVGLQWIAAATLPVASKLPFWVSFRLSPKSVCYAAGLSILAATIVGILPALQATRGTLQTGFRIAEAGGLRLGRIWTALIVAQVGFAVALLPPALSSTWNDARDGFAGLGFPAGQFLSAQLGMDVVPGTGTAPRFAARQMELLRRLEAEPQAAHVTFSMYHPGNEGGGRIETENVAGIPSETDVREVRVNRVAVNFFSTFEVPVLAGRSFEQGDVAPVSTDQHHTNEEQPGSHAVVVNHRLAQQLFNGNALGRRIRYARRNRGSMAPSAQPPQWHEIVGVVPDFPTGASPGMRDGEQLKVYHAVAPGQVQPVAIAIRMRGDAASSLTERLRSITAAVHPDIYLRDVRTLDEVMRGEQWISRMTAATFAAITVSVLLLSAAGIYALTAFTVAQRRKEIGIRLALGAGWTQIVASIFSRALLQLAAGAALGAALGLVLEMASGGVLLRGNAAVVIPAVSFVILTVGLLAALGPTRRSLRIDPTEALREQ
jgi:putative ABC transport system permease protein